VTLNRVKLVTLLQLVLGLIICQAGGTQLIYVCIGTKSRDKNVKKSILFWYRVLDLLDWPRQPDSYRWQM